MRIYISVGDPSGVGPELVLRLLPKLFSSNPFFLSPVRLGSLRSGSLGSISGSLLPHFLYSVFGGIGGKLKKIPYFGRVFAYKTRIPDIAEKSYPMSGMGQYKENLGKVPVDICIVGSVSTLRHYIHCSGIEKNGHVAKFLDKPLLVLSDISLKDVDDEKNLANKNGEFPFRLLVKIKKKLGLKKIRFYQIEIKQKGIRRATRIQFIDVGDDIELPDDKDSLGSKGKKLKRKAATIDNQRGKYHTPLRENFADNVGEGPHARDKSLIKYSPGREAGHEAWKILIAVREAIKWDISERQLVRLVTGPIDKSSITPYEKNFVGHTGFLADSFGVKNVNMSFITPLFNVVLATDHIPLKDVHHKLTKSLIIKTIHAGLLFQKTLGDTQPLVVLSINPHAGEGGKIGKEDDKIFKIVRELKQKGFLIEGPLGADGAFREATLSARRGRKRTLVAMYHDQGLVAAKMASENYDGVNVTLGLPFIRTSVDHGTAYSLVGTGRAKTTSLEKAISVAYWMRDSK